MRPFGSMLLALCLVWLPGMASAQTQSAPASDPPPPAKATDIAGTWVGPIEVSGAKVRIVLHIVKTADGKLTASIDVPEQGATGIPVTTVTVTGDTLKLGIGLIASEYEGKIAPGAGEIVGEWRQSGAKIAVTFRRSEGEIVLRRPQEPQKPYPYAEEEVSFRNEKAGVKLAGTLTRPTGAGPFPAVVLISGSGAQDRDETLFGHKPFLVIADYLTRRGLAVLRVDDRGVGGSEGSLAKCTSLDLAGDTEAAVAFLRTRKDVQAHRIGLLGHSEGGIIAPIVANGPNDIAVIVTIGGPALTGERILDLQIALILRAAGGTDQQVAAARERSRRVFAVCRGVADPVELEKKLRPILRDIVTKLPPGERKAIGSNVDAWITSQIRTVASPWFHFFLSYDPAPALRQLRCPLLAVYGEKDLQVPPSANVPAMEAALKPANRDYTVRVLPGLNHLLQQANTGAPSEYGQIEQTIAPTALQTIGDWLAARLQLGPAR